MKKPLRINKKFHRNEGTRDRTLRGKREVHMILKFDSEQEYETFKTDLKEWYYGEEQKALNIIQADDKTKKPVQKKKPGRPKKTT